MTENLIEIIITTEEIDPTEVDTEVVKRDLETTLDQIDKFLKKLVSVSI